VLTNLVHTISLRTPSLVLFGFTRQKSGQMAGRK